MRIESLRQPTRQGGKVKIVFEDETTLSVLPSVASEQALYVGRDLDDGELAALKQAAGEASAKARAVRIISATGVTKRELERRLVQKGESARDAQEAVAWLSDLHLLDDAETARQIVARGVAKGYGERRIRQMLYEKQVPKQYWDAALADIPAMDDELDRFLQKKLRGSTERAEIDRAVQALLRRGHKWPEIRAALSRYDAQIDLEEE